MTPAACNQVLQVLVKYGKSVEANTLFDNMLNARISLENDTSFGFGVNSETYNIMVNESFRLGNVVEALFLFNNRKGTDKTAPETFIMDALGYNNIIAKLCDIGMLEEAEKVFQEALDYKPVKREHPNVHPCWISKMVPRYYEVDSPSGMANVTTFKILFNAYFKEESIDKVLKWFKFLLFETSLQPSYVLVNSVLSRLIARGRIEDAIEILGKMPLRDTEPFPTCYELVLTELCKGGNLDSVLYLVGLMVRYKVGITPKLYSILGEPFQKNDFMDVIVRLLKRPDEASYADLQIEQPAGLLHAPVS
ncbi:Pentatricopeptide repeat-containing protein [Thalictrum thalictroides]|uniref:Pentatricopeptide repeat-containing protein n=1 Tax=Thalictrum thalictroides TaxID=46969 RepID=A0A7J6VIU7_THATH|nr:Pentatricopeptide repeat-containing protein [Thalictrum thalictroides]